MKNRIRKEWAGGKGSAPRPMTVNKKTFNNNWDLAFKKPEDKQDANIPLQKQRNE